MKPWPEARLEFERTYLRQLLKETNGNMTEAAKIAGRNRTKLYVRLQACGIKAKDYRVVAE